jgi:hypothetical protein
VLLLALPAVVQAQFTYTTNNDQITITGDTNVPVNGVVAIPSTILVNGVGLTVTSIGNSAFQYNYSNYSLTSVTIPNTVTTIGLSAFNGCTALASVTLGTGVTTIGDAAFESCAKLASITIPNSVTNLGDGAFAYCSGLTSVTFGTGVTSIGQQEFFDSGLTSVTIPTIVTNIGAYAFEGSPLTSVAIPASVTNIGAYAFLCYTLTSFTADPQNLFYSSTNGVLFNKSKTTLAEYPAGAVGSYAIPSGVTNIGPTAFNFCTNLTSITIPNSFTSIGAGAFEYCSGLTNVTISTSITTIGTSAFGGATRLFSVTIPSSVTSIGQTAFIGCTTLTSVAIPNSVTNIGAFAFVDCLSLTAISVDTSNPTYGSVAGALLNKSRTTLIQYPIGSAAKNYMIPGSVTSIGEEAFAYCTSLTNVTIPTSVTSIGGDAFLDCTSLASVYFQGNAPGDVATEFAGDNATIYYLPGTIGWGATFGGLPTMAWTLPYPLILNSSPSFGVRTNQFGFIVSWVTNVSVVVEACTNLTGPMWQPLQTNTLTNGYFYFSDPQWTNSRARFYRLYSP